jgi:hypothetical protein
MLYVIKNSKGDVVHQTENKLKSDAAIARFLQDEKDKLLPQSWHMDGPFHQETIAE